MKSQINSVQKILIELDPINLIGGGAPVDSYDSLASKLLILLKDPGVKKTDLEHSLMHIFETSFYKGIISEIEVTRLIGRLREEFGHDLAVAND